MDSAEPRWRRKIDSTTMAPTARNSLCQFWNDWNQNSASADELPRAHGGLAVLCLLGRVLVGAADGVADERADEQHRKARSRLF